MFRSIPEGPQPVWKRPVYLVLTSFLGLLVSFGLHALIELWYLHWAETSHVVVSWTTTLGMCALPLWVQIALPIGGLIGGYFQGRIWWRWVYVERRWEVHQKKSQA